MRHVWVERAKILALLIADKWHQIAKPIIPVMADSADDTLRILLQSAARQFLPRRPRVQMRWEVRQAGWVASITYIVVWTAITMTGMLLWIAAKLIFSAAVNAGQNRQTNQRSAQTWKSAFRQITCGKFLNVTALPGSGSRCSGIRPIWLYRITSILSVELTVPPSFTSSF